MSSFQSASGRHVEVAHFAIVEAFSQRDERSRK